MSDASRTGVVYLVTELPLASTSGGQVRAASIATALAEGHRVTLLAPDQRDGASAAWLAAAERHRARRESPASWARDIATGIVRREHTILVRALHAGVDEAFETIVVSQRPAFVVLERPFIGRFVEIAHRSGARVAVDAGEWMGRLNRQVARHKGPIKPRLRALVETYTLEPMERRAYLDADQVWVASSREAGHFARWIPSDRIRVIPNAIPGLASREPCWEGIRAVAYLGSYGHAPNEAAAIELMRSVMPAIRAAGGPRELRIIGRGPTEAMRRAADRETVIVGEVADAAAALCEAGILVVPLRSGGGTRIKILEAAIAGVPVVTTAIGLEGLAFSDGRSVIVADSASEMADAVARLVRDGELCRRLTTSAREIALERYGQSAVNEAVDRATCVRWSWPATADRGTV